MRTKPPVWGKKILPYSSPLCSQFPGHHPRSVRPPFPLTAPYAHPNDFYMLMQTVTRDTNACTQCDDVPSGSSVSLSAPSPPVEPSPAPENKSEAEQKPEGPRVFGSTTHTFEAVGFSLFRTLMRDVRGPLAGYVSSTFTPSPAGSTGSAAPECNDPHLEEATDCKRPFRACAGSTGHSLFPAPPPYVWNSGEAEGGKAEAGRRIWVNLIISTLSFLELGRPGRAPFGCRVGDPINEQQAQMIERIERLLTLWSGTTCEFVPDVLGRVTKKLQIVLTFFEKAAPLVAWIRAELDPYGKFRARIPRALRDVQSGLSSLRMRVVESCRLKFGSHLASFWPGPYVKRSTLMAYMDPRRIHRDVEPPSRPRGNFATVVETLKVMFKWDESNMLMLFPEEFSNFVLRGGLGAVEKDPFWDRLIFICTGENDREGRLPFCAASELPHAVCFCEYDLSDGSELRISAEDLRDYYFSFLVTLLRALRNCVQGVFKLGDFRSTSAYKSYRAMFGGTDVSRVVGAMATMGQGDGSAVDVGEEAHIGMGLLFGAFLRAQLITYRSPMPRGSFRVGCMLDDLVATLQSPSDRPDLRKPESEGGTPGADSNCMKRMRNGYKFEDLVSHETKRVDRAHKGVFWGGFLEGAFGAVCAPMQRTLCQILLTLTFIRVGCGPLIIFQIMTGTWIFILMFRRCMFALLFVIFKDIEAGKEEDLLILSRRAKTKNRASHFVYSMCTRRH